MLLATLTALSVLLTLLTFLVVATTTVRYLRARTTKASAARRSQLRALAIVALELRPGDPDAAAAALTRATRRHRAELVDIFTSVATTVSHDTRPKIVSLCSQLNLIEPVLAGLHHPEPARRVAAAEIVSLFGGPEHHAALHLAMRDAHPRVRLAAARAFLGMSPATAAPAILRMSRHEDADVAGELAELLRQHATGMSAALLSEWSTGTRTPMLVSLISQTVEQSAALSVLSDAAHSTDPALRRAALAGLANIPTTLALHTLTDATGDPDPEVRALAASALGVLAGPSTLPVLIALLDDPVWAVRHRAAAALASAPDGARLMAGLLGQATPFVTTAVTTALQRAMTTGGLLTDLTDPDPGTAARARRAVQALVKRPEMARTLQAALTRHPDATVRTALAELVPTDAPAAALGGHGVPVAGAA